MGPLEWTRSLKNKNTGISNKKKKKIGEMSYDLKTYYQALSVFFFFFLVDNLIVGGERI